jgi:hypothetical protein
MSSNLHDFRGECHCGAIGFTFQTALAVPRWSIRACQCRFCRSHGVVTTSDPAGRLLFRVNDADSLQRYRFGLKTADFLLCRRCGVYIGTQMETARGAFGIINAMALTPVPQDLPAAATMNYELESSSERTGRREERWTPLDPGGFAV